MVLSRDTRLELVAQGFTQTFGVDYKETFAHVAKMNLCKRLLLSIGMSIVMVPISNGCEECFSSRRVTRRSVYAASFKAILSLEGNVVCKLHKAIYGLKQSPKSLVCQAQFSTREGWICAK